MLSTVYNISKFKRQAYLTNSYASQRVSSQTDTHRTCWHYEIDSFKSWKRLSSLTEVFYHYQIITIHTSTLSITTNTNLVTKLLWT